MYFVASTGESVRGNNDFTAAAVIQAATAAGIQCHDELSDSQQPLLDDAGQLAASDTRDLVVRLSLLATAVASGFVRKAGGDDLISERLATLADEPTVENWHSVCKSLRDFVNEDYREHRLSRLMLHTQYVPKGVIKPAYLHMNHAHAAVSNNPERVDRGESVGILHPTWFAVSADLPLVSAADLRNFGIEAFGAARRSMSGQLVAAENTALLRLLQSASNIRSNQAQVLAGGLDFYMWRRMADSLKVSATSAVLAHSAWMQLVLTARRWPAAISAHYEAPEQHEQAFEGFFGSFAGVDIHTDGHAAPHLRALGREQVIMAIPERSLGIVQYMLNDDNFHVTDNHSAGTYSVGMHMNRLVSMTVLTVDGVAVGTVAK